MIRSFTNNFRNLFPIILILSDAVNEDIHLILCPFLLIVFNCFIFQFLQLWRHQQWLHRVLGKIIWSKNFWIIFVVKAILTKNVWTRKFFQNLVNWIILLEVFKSKIRLVLKWVRWCLLLKPNLVIANYSTEVANRRIRWRNCFDFLWSYHVKICVWTAFFIHILLDLLGLRDIYVPFNCGINYSLTHISTFTKLYFCRSQIWLNIEVNEPPML